MAAPIRQRFCVAVDRVLNSWTVLKLAVSHGFGGADSEAKAAWMVQAIDQWFAENANIETYELEDFLEDVLDAEFDTIADDGSLTDIARMICGLYRLCVSGDEAKLEEQLSKLPPSNLQACQPANVPSQEQTEDCEDDDLDPDNPPSLAGNQSTPQQNSDHMETDAAGAEGEDDGWTTVGKKTKRR